jgi:hypothetical protein
MTRPYVYCPHRHKVQANVNATATPSQVTRALMTELTNHIIDTNEVQLSDR